MPINNDLIFTLRRHRAPVAEDHLARLYEDLRHFKKDLQALMEHGLVRITPYGVAWDGS